MRVFFGDGCTLLTRGIIEKCVCEGMVRLRFSVVIDVLYLIGVSLPKLYGVDMQPIAWHALDSESQPGPALGRRSGGGVTEWLALNTKV